MRTTRWHWQRDGNGEPMAMIEPHAGTIVYDRYIDAGLERVAQQSQAREAQERERLAQAVNDTPRQEPKPGGEWTPAMLARLYDALRRETK